MYQSNYNYQDGTQELVGFLAYNESKNAPRPAVIVAHDWTGRNDFACQKASRLAELGYVGFALDMYGDAKLGTTNEEKMALMTPLASDRRLLQQRVRAAFEAVAVMPEVDTTRIAIIGFCFGGLCALDLARSGASIKGSVSFHGLLGQPDFQQTESIKAKVLALHGYEDPMVTPEQVMHFCDEMTQAKVDWQMHMYGHVQHAFTNPQAHDEQLGLMYNAQAELRSWSAMTAFLEEIF